MKIINELLSESKDFPKYKRFIFIGSFISIIVSIFFSLLFQSPFFVGKSINKISIVLWIVSLVFVLLLDIRNFLKVFIPLIICLIPFLLYICIISLVFKETFISELSRCFVISLLFFIIGKNFGDIFGKKYLKFFLYTYLVGALILCLIVVFSILIKADLNSSIYAYSSKNSTGIIALASLAICCSLFCSEDGLKRFIFLPFSLFFLVFIILVKCRAAMISVPFLFLFLIINFKCNYDYKVITLFLAVMLSVFLFAIPFFYKNIIVKFVFNGNTTLDSISSGRITLIANSFGQFNVFFGKPNYYLDFFPINIIANYGIVGTVFALPILALPLIPVFLSNKVKNSYLLKSLLCALIISFFISGVFEGFGHFGPGLKVFILWFLSGYAYDDRQIPFKKVTNFINKNNVSELQDYFLSSVQLITFILVPIVVLTNLFSSLSLKIYDKMPFKKEVVSEYIEPESIELKGPEVLCVGQKVQYSSSIFPENTTDKGKYWQIWGDNGGKFQLDDSEGVVTALKECGGYTLTVGSSKKNSLYSTMVIKTISTDEYAFNDFKISCKENALNINETLEIEYDYNYVPSSVPVEFCSTNNDVATIDEYGFIKGIKVGETTIFAKIENKQGTFLSNEIKIEVKNGSVNLANSFQVVPEREYFENVPYKFEPIFDHNVTEQKYIVLIDGLRIKTQSFFLKAGLHKVDIIYVANASIRNSFEITCFSNPLKKLEIDHDNYYTVGSLYTPKIYSVFENGYRKLTSSSELKSKTSEYRAWHNKNGLCEDNLSFFAIKQGSFSNKYESKNGECFVDFTAKIISIPFETYKMKATAFFAFLVFIFTNLILVFSIFENGKIKNITSTIGILISALFSLTIILNKISVFIGVINLDLAILIYLINLQKKKRLIIFCENEKIQERKMCYEFKL